MTSPEPHGPVDLLVRHGCLVLMDDAGTIVTDGAVAVRDGEIVAVGEDATLAGLSATTVIDAGGAPVHPGLVEAHLHCSYQLFRSAVPDQLAEEDVFRTVESAFYNAVDDEDEHASTLLAALEMIRHGTTAFLEPGTVLEVDAAAAAVRQVGIRGVLADSFLWDEPSGLAMGRTSSPARNESVIERAPSDRSSVRAKMGGAVRRYADDDVVSGHVAVLGLGTASEELMVEAKRIAAASASVLNFHHAYSPADLSRDRERFGADPITRLAERGVVDGMTTMAHVNTVSDADFATLVRTGATVAWAPGASMMWGHGSTLDGAHARLHREGGSVALGSDSPNWSNGLDLFRQADLAAMSARERYRDRGALMAEDVLHMATRGGARALGMGERIGSIEPGKRADLVIHTLRRPELVPLTDVVRNLVHSAGSRTVDTVIVNGVVVLRDGEFTSIDEASIVAHAAERSRRLLDRMGYVVPRNLSRRSG